MKLQLRNSSVAILAAASLLAGGQVLAVAPAKKTDASLRVLVERNAAVNDINNLMGRYSFYHTAGMHVDCVDLFAMKTADVSSEMVWGVYKGPAGIKKLYPGFHMWADGDGIGKMFVHLMTTPVIEVAGDGKTAKGVWASPGSETMPDKFGVVQSKWSWIKYAADFIKEDGVWKIWHLHVYGLYSAEPGKSWVDMPFNPDQVLAYAKTLPAEYQPDAPPTTRLWKYRTDVKTELLPAPPKPYYTFDPKTAY